MNRIILISVLMLMFLNPSLAKQDISLPSIEDILPADSSELKAAVIISNIKEKIRESPEDANLYGQLAFVYDYIGDYTNEIEAAKLHIKYLPKDAESLDITYGNLARAYMFLEKFDEAKPIIDKALSLNQENMRNHGHLLSYLIAKDMHKEAAAELKIVSAYFSDRDYYYEIYNYAVALKKELPSLVELFREGVKENPNSHLAHRMLAVAIRNASLNLKDELPQIMDEFNKSLAINARFIPTYVSIGDTYVLLGEQTKNKEYFKDAMRWFKNAEKIDHKDIRLACAISNLFSCLEQYDKAISKMERLFNQGQKDDQFIDALTRAYNNKAYACYTSGKNLKSGLKTIDKALSMRSNDGMYLSTKAELLFKLNRLNEAYAYIKKAIVIMPDEPEIQQDLRNIEKALNRQKEVD